MPYGYTLAYAAAVAVAAILAGLAVIQAGNPADFGLSPLVVKWLGVVTAVLGIVAGALPSWRRPPSEERRGLD